MAKTQPEYSEWSQKNVQIDLFLFAQFSYNPSDSCLRMQVEDNHVLWIILVVE